MSLHPFHVLEDVFDLLPDAIIVVDRYGRIVMNNQQALTFFGYEYGELISKPISMLIPSRFREGHSAHVDQYAKKKEARKMAAGIKLFALRKDHTEIQVDIALGPYEISGSLYTIAVVRELSDKLSLEKRIGDLERTKDELERFAYVVSHDLKSPVKRMHSLVDMICRELPEKPDEHLQTLISFLHQSVSLTEKLIDGILEEARLENSVQSDGLNLNDVFQEAVSAVVIPENFNISLLQPLPVLRGNSTQWLQIFINLITNAVKYNDKERGILTIDWIVKPGLIEFHFSDNGTVVPSDKRELIFTLFQRAHGHNDSSHGIGLAIVRRIVEKNMGRIYYQGSDMRGSEFVIEWPIPR